MERAIIIRGRLADSRHIELDEPVDELEGDVEITLRPVTEAARPRRDIADIIASMRGGQRSKEDIDAQLAEERASWGDR